MNNLLILGLIIILFISLIYRVYKRKKKEGMTGLEILEKLSECNLSGEGKFHKNLMVKNFNNVPDGAPLIIDYHREKICNDGENENYTQKLEWYNEQMDILSDIDMTLEDYFTKYPEDEFVDKEKAIQLTYKQKENTEEKVDMVSDDDEKELITGNFFDIKCNSCDDIGPNCGLYYEKEKGFSEMSIYYKNPWSLRTHRVFDEFNEKDMREFDGHLIKLKSDCDKIKDLEKCKNVNSCVDIRGSEANRKNCVICEAPEFNGSYTIQKEHPNENETETHDIKIQNGFPLNW